MSKILYILGNGFDIFHGLPTSYRCFLCYMQRTHPLEVKSLGFMFDRNDPYKLWSNFEEELESFDVLELVKNNIGEWIKLSKKDFYNLFENIHSALQEYFHEWILQTPMGVDNGKRLPLNKNALFLNFNYTNTLEDFYHIDSANICHIHGNTMQNQICKPIAGHSRTKNCVEKDKCKVYKFIRDYGQFPQWAKGVEDFAEVVLKELNELWDGLAKEPKNQIVDNKIHTIRDNRWFFDKCCKLEDIYVMGCSLGIVDKDYFKEIYESSPNAKWHISIYSEKESEVNEKLANLLNRKVENLHIDTFKMDELLK